MTIVNDIFVCGINTHSFIGGPYDHHIARRSSPTPRGSNSKSNENHDDENNCSSSSSSSSSSSGNQRSSQDSQQQHSFPLSLRRLGRYIFEDSDTENDDYSDSYSEEDDVDDSEGVMDQNDEYDNELHTCGYSRDNAQEWRKMSVQNWCPAMSLRYSLHRVVCGYDLTYLIMKDRENNDRHQLFVLGLDTRGLKKGRREDEGQDNAVATSTKAGGSGGVSNGGHATESGNRGETTSVKARNSSLWRVDMSLFGHCNILSISDFYSHCLIVTDDHMVYAGGYDTKGQLGISEGYHNNMSSFDMQMVEFFQDKPVKIAVGGESFSIFVTMNNCLYSTGSNAYGQLGIGGNSIKTFRPTRVPFPSDKDIVDVKCGIAHSVILCADGTVFTAGQNYEWQCGHPGSNVNTPTQIDLPNGSVKSIRCGYNTTYLLMKDGSVVVSGSNSYGQLGYPISDKNPGRTRTFNLNSVCGKNPLADICPGFFHAVFVTQDGKLYGSGLNNFNQLGSSGFDTIKIPTRLQVVDCTDGGTLETTGKHLMVATGRLHTIVYATEMESSLRERSNMMNAQRSSLFSDVDIVCQSWCVNS